MDDDDFSTVFKDSYRLLYGNLILFYRSPGYHYDIVGY